LIEKPNFIEVYKNVLSPEFCDEIIHYFNVAEKNNCILDRQAHDQARKIDKEDLATYLPNPSYPMHHTAEHLLKEFNDVLWGVCYKAYAEKYGVLHDIDKHSSYTMKIQKTEPGQGYHIWHCEADGRRSSVRLLAWTAYMNDDFEAGETEFLYQQYRYKPSRGDIIIFPAAFTHTHRGNPPINGTKYIITGWVEF